MFKHLKSDIPASIVVYLVALPLGLGIALASDAPPFAGIIAGIVGGVIVGSLSGSNISVSGPAAGLTVIVLDGIRRLQSFEYFLMAVVLAGILQVILGFLKAGRVGSYIPNSVIKGMLAAIGLILILKQIPHALGFDFTYEGDESFATGNGSNTIKDIYYAIRSYHTGALAVALASGSVLLLWTNRWMQYGIFKLVPGALLAVAVGTLLNELWFAGTETLYLTGDHLVKLPAGFTSIGELITFPDFSSLKEEAVYIVAVQLAIVASLESLLSLEASDKIDPCRRISSPNRELKAQGVGNLVSGLLGGLPITAVIVRSSANAVAGAHTRLSAILHGVLLLISVLLFPVWLNTIPKSALAAILILVGYKLVSPAVIKEVWNKGKDQFIPFIITILAILLTDLLKGIGIGLLVGIFFVIKSNFRRAITFVRDGNKALIKLRENVTYLNKGSLKEIMESIPANSQVLIDGTLARFIDSDIADQIDDFLRFAPEKNLDVTLFRNSNSRNDYFRTDGIKFPNE